MQRNPIRVAGIFALACALYAFGQASVPEYNIYYGDNHAHTSYSDGMGRRNPDGTAPPGRRPTPADAFAQARASGLADYFVASEHSGYARGAYFNLNPALWESARKMADEGSKDGAFIAIAGLEYSPQGKFLEGHMNVFNTGSELYPDPHPREEFYDLIANKDGVVAQWNHPALQYDLNNFKQFSGWTPARN
ncbi:MAG: hypothetical protein H7039_08770, partial [Bryobacteraceae bacterium]|nr:hypothetical protein [Bryobacteraceae bacterium]